MRYGSEHPCSLATMPTSAESLRGAARNETSSASRGFTTKNLGRCFLRPRAAFTSSSAGKSVAFDVSGDRTFAVCAAKNEYHSAGDDKDDGQCDPPAPWLPLWGRGIAGSFSNFSRPTAGDWALRNGGWRIFGFAGAKSASCAGGS